MKTLKKIISSIEADTYPAIKTADSTSISYKELVSEWNLLQAFIKDNNLTIQSLGIYCKEKLNTIVTIGACLLEEIVYVPLDAYGSSARNKIIIEQAGLQAIISDEEIIMFDLQLTIVSQYKIDRFFIYILNDTVYNAFPDQTAYILHTSGSSGIPKGVMISHQNATCFIDWCVEEFKLPYGNNMVSIAPFHFDLSVFDLFVALKTHSSLLLIDQPHLGNPRLVAELLIDQKIQILYATPSFYINLYNYGKLPNDGFAAIKLFLFAGEEFPSLKFESCRKFFPNALCYNLYGPTETNVATYYPIPVVAENIPIPIGQSCPYNELMLCDDEIWVSGENVALGYLNDTLLTNQKFINLHGKIWYKTGDFAAYNTSGQLLFKGRKDRMVKRNGYRIELDEIQNVLLGYKDITHAAVIAKARDEMNKIIAFYSSDSTINQLELRKEFLQFLPQYMMPDRFIFIQEIPISNSGKIDYQLLSNLELDL